MEWSNELILEFLDLYECEPCIWNPRHTNHKNRTAVHDAWRRIESSFSAQYPLSQLKKKKDALMASYRRSFSKFKASSKSGSGGDEVHKPDWFAYEKMDKFLHGIYNPRATSNSEENQNELCLINEDTQHREFEFNEIKQENGIPSLVEISFEQSHNSDSNFKAPTESQRGKQRRTLESNIDERMDEAYVFLKKFAAEQEQDDCDLYAQLLAKKLRSLDESTREYAMLEIDGLIYRLRNSAANKSPQQQTQRTAFPSFSQHRHPSQNFQPPSGCPSSHDSSCFSGFQLTPNFKPNAPPSHHPQPPTGF